MSTLSIETSGGNVDDSLSLEMRWFWIEEPRDWTAWFFSESIHKGQSIGRSDRMDYYLLQGQEDESVKTRAQAIECEIKELKAVLEPVSISDREGRPQLWQKRRVRIYPAILGQFIPIKKTRFIRRLGQSGRIEWTVIESPMLDSSWASFCIEVPTHDEALTTALGRLTSSLIDLKMPALLDGTEASYPTWLCERFKLRSREVCGIRSAFQHQ